MNNLKYFACYILVLVLISCDKEITLDIPDLDSVLVVNGYVSPEQGAIVDISHSIKDITKDSIIALDDAKVSLYEDGIYVEDLEHTILGDPQSVQRAYYTNANVKIKEGREYRLEVEHRDYENVEATTRIPSLSIEPPILKYIGNVNDHKSKLKVTIQENKSGEYYYAFIIKNSTKLYEIVDGDTLIIPGFGGENISFVEFEETGLSDLANTGLEIYRSSSDFALSAIDNSFFINGKMELTFDLYTIQTSLPGNQFLGEEVIVQVRQMSKEYFEYIRTLSIHEEVEGDPFASEVIVSNNIEGGLGNFSGFQVIESNVVEF